MKKYNSHTKGKKLKKQKYPALKEKYTPILPTRPSILNNKVNTDEIVHRIEKWCDDAKNNKNGRQ